MACVGCVRDLVRAHFSPLAPPNVEMWSTVMAELEKTLLPNPLLKPALGLLMFGWGIPRLCQLCGVVFYPKETAAPETAEKASG